MKTQVIFRYWRNDVIALFPYEIADMKGNCLSYQHIGQHGAANYSAIVYESRPATPTEYAAIQSELEKLGYNLEIIHRRNHQRFYDAYIKARWIDVIRETSLEVICDKPI